MKTGVEKAVGALRMAMRIEQNGYRFYRRAAAQSSHEGAVQLFEGLAEDELAHQSMVERQLEALERGGMWKRVVEEDWVAQASHLHDGVVFSREQLEDGVGDYTSELSALRMAYLIEKNAVEFYSNAAEQTEDAVGKAMYQALTDWEQDHQDRLEEEYRFLAERFKLDMGFAPF